MSRSSSKASFSRHRPVLRAVFIRPAGHRGIRQRRCLWRVDRPDPRPRIGRRRQQLDHNRLSPARQGRQDGGSGFCCQHRGLQPDRGVLGPLDFMGWRRQRAVSILDDAGRPGCRGLVRPPSSRLINPAGLAWRPRHSRPGIRVVLAASRKLHGQLTHRCLRARHRRHRRVHLSAAAAPTRARLTIPSKLPGWKGSVYEDWTTNAVVVLSTLASVSAALAALGGAPALPHSGCQAKEDRV